MSRPTRTPTHRPGRPLVALATSATRNPRMLGIGALIVGALITWVILLSVNGVPFQKRYKLTIELPTGALPVDTADTVRIAGQRAGIVKSSVPVDGGTKVEVEILPAYWPIGEETTAKVRVRPASGLTFIDLSPKGGDPLEDGGTIQRAQVTSGTSLPEAAEAFDAATRTAVAGILRTGGAAVAGQGEALNTTAQQLPRMLREGVPVADALTPEPGDLTNLVTGGQAIARGLGGSGQLPATLRDTATTVEAIDQRRDDLAATVDAAGPLLAQLNQVSPELDALLDQLTKLSRDVTPATESLAAELPVLRRALASSPELRRAATRLGPVASKALAQGPRAMYAMRGPVELIRPAVDPITTITELLDGYRSDLLAGVKGLEAVTSKTYAEGFTAPGNPGLRFGAVFTCGTARNPYPAPRTSRQDAGEKGQC